MRTHTGTIANGPETTLGDLRMVALLLTFAFALKGGPAPTEEPVEGVNLIGEGGRGEFVREGGLEDVDGAL